MGHLETSQLDIAVILHHLRSMRGQTYEPSVTAKIEFSGPRILVIRVVTEFPEFQAGGKEISLCKTVVRVVLDKSPVSP